jgi:hypothetical protein
MKPIIFAIVIISRILFLWFSDDDRLFVHPLTRSSVSHEAFIWQIGNFLPIILLGFMSIFGDKTWTITTIAFTVLAFIDYADWILRGSHVWWWNGIIPISMNTLTGFVFAVSFMYEYVRYGESGKLKL